MSALDAVVGIAASGRTPYTIGAVEHARALGAFTVAVTCAPDSAITRAVDVAIVPVVGPEVLAGSTRMKAGTAQKLVLNMLSTMTMIRLGYVTGNRMTNMRARNSKLHARSIRIIRAETGVDDAAAQAALERTGDDLPVGHRRHQDRAHGGRGEGGARIGPRHHPQGHRGRWLRRPIRQPEVRDASDNRCCRSLLVAVAVAHPAVPATARPDAGAAAAHHRFRRASR